VSELSAHLIQQSVTGNVVLADNDAKPAAVVMLIGALHRTARRIRNSSPPKSLRLEKRGRSDPVSHDLDAGPAGRRALLPPPCTSVGAKAVDAAVWESAGRHRLHRRQRRWYSSRSSPAVLNLALWLHSARPQTTIT